MSFRQFCRALPVFILLAGCSKRELAPVAAERVTAMAPETRSEAAQNFEATLPEPLRSGGYTGSGACQKCHQDQYGTWHRSFHRTMTQVVSDESVQADFNNVVLQSDSARFTLNKRAGEYWVRMEPLVQPPVENGPAPALEQRLSLVTGSHHMQVFWVPEGSGNLQLGFPFTWLIPEKKWVPRNSTFVRPPDLPHHAEIWNAVCSRCHTTGVEPRLNFAARTAETRAAELGISCEACHGPGERHVQAQQGGRKEPGPGEIIHPKKLTAERSAQVCGFCHSMKWIDKSSHWRENGFEYRPGDDLEKTTPIIRPARVDAIAGLKDYLARNPDVLNDFFWPDGMIRVSGREYNALVESPCYKGGKFSCLSCHSLHESEPDDQLAAKATGNGACLQCHEPFREPARLAAHTHHADNSSGSLCYNCHMPHTTYGILKAIRSHQISSPRVADDLASGRPNACNLCHLDKTLSWTAGHLAAWYRQPVPAQRPEPDALPHIANLALRGDAGQRVLAAWHLGWDEARRASSNHWTSIILSQLLDDPYAAVRCVAERSLPQTVKLAGYDFTVDPRARRPARDEVWKEWRAAESAGRVEAVWLKNGEIDREQIDRLVKERDERPIRLRE